MKQLLTFLILMTTIQAWAEDFIPENLIPPQFQFQGTELGAPPSLEDDCNCDGNEDGLGERTKKSKRPLIELSLSLAEDRTVPSSASMLDCDTLVRPKMKQIMDDLLNDLAQGTYSTMEEYQAGIEERSSVFNDLEKICFVSQNASEFQQYYTNHLVRDGFGNNIGTQEVVEGYQDGENGAVDPTTGVCIDIHKASGQAGEASGVQCGTMVNQWDAQDYNSAGVLVTTSSRFMHAVNVCKVNGEYYMINYGKAFKLDTPTYQTAIDSANLALANANFAGNQMTCLDDEGRNFHNCNHAYLSRDARWIVNSIGSGLDQMDSSRAPISIEAGNLGVKARGNLVRERKKVVDENDGDTREKTTRDGLLMIFDNYRWNQANFGTIGYGRKSTTTTTEELTDSPKKTSEFEQYIGVYGVSTPNTHNIYLTDPNQSHVGIVYYANRETQRQLSEKLRLETKGELIAGVGIDTILRPGENADPGMTNEGTAALVYDLNNSTSLFGKHRASIMTGNENNLPTLFLGQSSIGLTKEFFEQNPNINLTNTSQVHVMYGDPTVALQNTTDLSINLLGTVQIDGNLDAGYTFASDDFFYDQGLWTEGSLGVSAGLWENQLRILGHVDASTGGRPQQFGQGLAIEDNPVPGLEMPGFSGGIKLILVK